MRVEPISLNSCSSCDFSWIQSASANEATDLFNQINGVPSPTQINIFQFTSPKLYTPQDETIFDYGYVNAYLQYGNEQIHKLAMEIVNTSDSDDEKMEKIQKWVVRNIEYMTDEEQYGYNEIWVPPTMLLNTMKGDCEDQAFLIMSLALNSGVDPNRLRFYGGVVKAGEGAATGGHGWVAYKREHDDAWVTVDATYYPDLRPMDLRPKMKDDTRYIDDYFMFEVGKVIITPDNNRVRNPRIYNNYARVQPNVLLPGTWVNGYA
jgi:predicted transglutaminase-like cysteine proteinase